MEAFGPWMDEQSSVNTPLDQIFNLLHLEYGKDEVNALVTKRLSVPLESNKAGYQHGLLKRISSSKSGMPQIVTTNFDRLFELNDEGLALPQYVPPAFPDINFGTTVEGVTYLHGRLVELSSTHHSYVLSSADFGRAYLSEGWATNFIRHLLEQFTVVLVGYQAEDPPIKYLLQGLNHDGLYDRSKLYAFDRGLPEEIEAKWRDRGVTAIAYSEYSDLWIAMEAWANRVDDPRKWYASIIEKSRQDPKALSPNVRGQVAHVLRSVQGARLFLDAGNTSHSEWICVMDPSIRSAKQSRGYDAGIFDPVEAYCLDDDIKNICNESIRQGPNNENLLEWRSGDDNPHDSHRLSSHNSIILEVMPKRLAHLINWIATSIGSPVIAWWVIRQNTIHPQLFRKIEHHVKRSKELDGRARHIWNLILEYHRNPPDPQWDSECFVLKRRMKVEGWTGSVLREFRRLVAPRVEVQRPSGLGRCKPPSVSWADIKLGDLGHFDVKIFKRHENLDIPEKLLPQVLSILGDQLTAISSILLDIEAIYCPIQSCYLNRENNGRNESGELSQAMAWFVNVFDKMASKDPVLANAYAMTWDLEDKFFFRKLKLYAFNNVDVFGAEHVAQEILKLDQEVFWDVKLIRELLFLLVDRWSEFPNKHQVKIISRILEGPDKLSFLTDEQHSERQKKLTASYARYLELKGCKFTLDISGRISCLIGIIPNWSDTWATNIVVSQGSYVSVIRVDEEPSSLLNIPVSQVVSKAQEELKRDFGSFTEKRPFTGLVKVNPRKALSALTIAGKSNNYPEVLWDDIIDSMPSDISSRLRKVFLKRISQLPYIVVGKLSRSLSDWLKRDLKSMLQFDYDLGLLVFDHVVSGITSCEESRTKSNIVEISRNGKPSQLSRRTLEYAINSSIGSCVEALFSVVYSEGNTASALVPVYIKYRVEQLFLAPGEGADHAVIMVTRRLNWIISIDPVWAKETIIPILAFEHPASEPAWNGIFNSDQNPEPLLVNVIKPLLIGLFPWVEKLAWDRDTLNRAAILLGSLRLFYSNESHGIAIGEMRSILREMSDDTRNNFIFWLGNVGQCEDNGWNKYVIPFISEDWPRERRYRTTASISAWIGLLDDAGDSISTVYWIVKKFLTTIEVNDGMFYMFARIGNHNESVAYNFPETILDLMDTVISQSPSRLPYELFEILELIIESSSSLRSDARYIRLITLVEKS